ncbi:hypothetical protein J3B02_001085 [Coemansia erecta]|uniref:Uncharacterized protein n=1 Tax=Coemansia asiatica TaxID=1052880 RepID=A0A9W7XLZ2_9FUNG|nr:hypothetical protein LPJ64_002506 [Coemansia asiatica]KAJ2857313.1 hypothetical protein J3B02_001085 [Coemansia erecta]
MYRNDSGTVPQKPLVISETKSKDLSIAEAAKNMSRFLDNEAGVQSAVSSIVQQLQQLQKHMSDAKRQESQSEN